MKLTSKLALLGILCLALLTPVLAQTYQQETDVDLKIPCINNNTYCSPAATCNLTIFYPNDTLLINNQAMTNKLSYFNYSLNSNQTLVAGNYTINMFCNDSGLLGYSVLNYEVTWNGQSPPGDSLSIFMILAFIALTIALIYTTFRLVREMAIFNVDIMDVAQSLIVFCVIIALYYFNTAYMADAWFDKFAKWFIDIGAITNVLIPMIGFVLTFFYHKTQWKEGNMEDSGGGSPGGSIQI